MNTTPKRPLAKIALLTALLLTATLHSPAQNTSPLDTAPGGDTASPMATPAVAAPATSPAAPGTNTSFLPNGNFAHATQAPAWPDAWPHDTTLPITYETEDATHFLRIAITQPGLTVRFARTVAIPAGIKGVDLRVRYRLRNFKFGLNAKGAPNYTQDFHFLCNFLDATGAKIEKSGGGFVMDSHMKDFADTSKQFLVPEGAAQIEIAVNINKVTSGTLDLAEIALSPMDTAALDTLAAAEKARAEAAALKNQKATQLDAGDAIEIPKLLALPQKTVAIKASGNKLVTIADGKDVWLKGVNVPSMEWSPKGEHILRSVKEALIGWKANVIRLPVNDSFWFGRGKGQATPADQETYRQTVDDAIRLAGTQGAYVILDLHRYLTPDDTCVAFWKDAAARYRDNPVVLFDLMNEPHGTTWDIWQRGGPVDLKQKDGTVKTIQGAGMQTLIDTVRATGAKNLVVVGGLSYALDLSGILDGHALDDKGGNGIMYSTHFYNWHGKWQKNFLDVAEKYPLLVGEFGADIKKMGFIPAKNQEDPYTWAPNALGLVQKYHLHFTAWSFHTGATPSLLLDWAYTPTPYWGQFLKDALAGKQFELQKIK